MSKLIKEIGNYYWEEVEQYVCGYGDKLANKMLKDQFNFHFSDDLITAIIYEDNSNLKKYRDRKIYAMLQDNIKLDAIKEVLQKEYDRLITPSYSKLMGWE